MDHTNVNFKQEFHWTMLRFQVKEYCPKGLSNFDKLKDGPYLKEIEQALHLASTDAWSKQTTGLVAKALREMVNELETKNPPRRKLPTRRK